MKKTESTSQKSFYPCLRLAMNQVGNRNKNVFQSNYKAIILCNYSQRSSDFFFWQIVFRLIGGKLDFRSHQCNEWLTVQRESQHDVIVGIYRQY